MSPEPKQTKTDRREAARDKARIAREAEARKHRNRKIITQLSIVVGILVIVAIVIAVAVNGNKPAVAQVNPKNLISNGAIVSGENLNVVKTAATKKGDDPTPTKTTADKTQVTVYLDYLCPYCNEFETANNATLSKLVKSGDITVEIHPVAVLDRYANHYSSHAANAAACVINYSPDNFWAYNSALFANQPEETSATGLSNRELYNIAKKTGVSNTDKIQPCITDNEFKDWVSNATSDVLNKAIPNSDLPQLTGTPTVLVDGQQYKGDPSDAAAFDSFLQSAIAAK